jgi:PTH1 family peptidyl-tRNA hydrolase
MKLIVGLGNPGSQYAETRHNVGFRVVDKLTTQLGWQWNEHRNRAVLSNGNIGPEKVVLVKPLTLMNNSGEAVGPLVHWYKLPPEDILVVYDELDLPVGKVRLRSNGSAAGHNGLENVLLHLHTRNIARLRIGIGRPTHNRMDTIHYVLGIPPTDERILLESGEDRAVEAIPLIIKQGLATTMNVINVDPEVEEQRRQQREQRAAERLRRAAERQAQQEQDQPSDESHTQEEPRNS